VRTVKQLTDIVTQATKNLHLEMARKWGIPASVITGATLRIGVTRMLEIGSTEDKIVEAVRDLVHSLTVSPIDRGSS
jgi:hypothetical protein